MEGQRLWQAVLDTAMNRPAPLCAFDAFFHLALIVTLRGTQQAVDYYRMLLAEMQERVSRGDRRRPERKIPAPLGQPPRLVPDEVALRKVRLPRTPASSPIPIPRPGAAL